MDDDCTRVLELLCVADIALPFDLLRTVFPGDERELVRRAFGQEEGAPGLELRGDAGVLTEIAAMDSPRPACAADSRMKPCVDPSTH